MLKNINIGTRLIITFSAITMLMIIVSIVAPVMAEEKEAGLVVNARTIDGSGQGLEKLSGTERVDALISLANLNMADSSELAKAYCAEASGLAILLNYKHGEALAVFCLGQIGRKSEEFEQAIKHLLNAYMIFQENNNEDMIVQNEMELGLTYFVQPNLEKAVNHFNQALNLYTQRNDSTGMSSAFYNLGRCYRKAGKLDLALVNSLKSLHFNEENNHNALNTISTVYAMTGQLDKALEYQKRALVIREKLGLQEKISGSLSNLGLISMNNNKFEQGLEYLLRSAKIAEESGNKSQLSRTLNNIGWLYDRHLNEAEKALQYYQRSLKISEEIKDGFEIANTLINIGALQSKLKRNDLALENLKTGIILAQETEAQALIQDGYDFLSQHYLGIGDYRQAFENYKSFVAIKDLIFSEESSNRITEMQVKYESEKKGERKRDLQIRNCSS